MRKLLFLPAAFDGGETFFVRGGKFVGNWSLLGGIE
jgi:hypothetical protein